MHDHAHAHRDADNQRRVLIAMLLTGGFMLVEVVGGIAAGSLALLGRSARPRHRVEPVPRGDT
jgi:Co/Zn/Cd efflux system component